MIERAFPLLGAIASFHPGAFRRFTKFITSPLTGPFLIEKQCPPTIGIPLFERDFLSAR